MKLLIASNNKHKADELRSILETHVPGVELLMLSDVMTEPLDVEESGLTLEENAYIKAKTFFDATGYACVADDTGLEIEALNGQPGVRTARFAGEVSYAENVRLVLERLNGVAASERNAQFRCVICYCDALRTLFSEGVCKGRIAVEASGDAGFGYDPVFIPEGYSTTFAQMDAAEKNRISHRGLALANFASVLKELWKESTASDKI